MAKNSGSGENIYGQIPDGGAKEVISEAMKDLGDSSSNQVRGPISSKDSDYPEKG